MDDPLTPAPLENTGKTESKDQPSGNKQQQLDSPIASWTYCTKCAKVVTPLVYISDDTWKFSFGKFLEVYFYNRDAILNAPEHGCSCPMQTNIKYFGSGRLAARFSYEKVKPYGVYVRRSLPFDEQFHREVSIREIDKISNSSSRLFVRFDKHIERVSREARQLFGSAVNKPEHLQTVLSELNAIGSEVDYAAKILQEKIAAVTNQCHVNNSGGSDSTASSKDTKKTVTTNNEVLFTFPWHARRYLFLLTSAWNERLSAAGQALAAMKKLAAAVSRGDIGQNALPIVGDGNADDVIEGMKRLRQLQLLYSQYNIKDMTIQSVSEPASRGGGSNRETSSIHHMHKNAARRQPQQSRRPRVNDYEYHDYDDFNDDIESEDDFDYDYNSASSGTASDSGQRCDSDLILTIEDIDADVIASRQRLQALSNNPSSRSLTRNQRSTSPNATKSYAPSHRQYEQEYYSNAQRNSPHHSSHYNTNPSMPQAPAHGYNNAFQPYDSSPFNVNTPSSHSNHHSRNKTPVTPGVVKSAITRFFNRGNKELDPYVVDLGTFAEGRPRLEPGVGGVVIPVFDDQHSTVIAHSLSSHEYDAQFKQFRNPEAPGSTDAFPDSADQSSLSDRPIDDYFGMKKGGQHNRGRYESSGSTRSVNKRGGNPSSSIDERKDIEKRMLTRSKTHIKHTFHDVDIKDQSICKFICTTYWSTQFHAVRQAFLSHPASSTGDDRTSNSDKFDVEKGYIRSLTSAQSWAASGGKSGASFSRTADGRFIVKCISRTELQMFLDCAPAYFEYLSKAFFHGLPTVLCKIVGVYQIGYHNRVTGKRSMEQVAIMQNIFYERKINITFDLKGSLRGRFAQPDKDKVDMSTTESSESDRASDSASNKPPKPTKQPSHKGSWKKNSNWASNDETDSEDYDDNDSTSDNNSSDDDESSQPSSESKDKKDSTNSKESSGSTLLDGDFLEFTAGRPLPLNDRAKAVFHMSILNDTLFLSIINVLDYSILVGIDEERMELVVGIIDFMRQYDILKQMERVGKSLPMVVGSEAPTIIQPPLYKARFTNAMERYFMTVPNKWTAI